ncbi:MAG: acetyltransferase [Planctomycetota bacterium]
MQPIVVFGAGKVADVIAACIERDAAAEILAYTCDADHAQADTFRGKPLLPFAEAVERFPPATAGMLVALGYHDCNALRVDRMDRAREAGYTLVGYTSRRALVHPEVALGPNTVVLDGAIVQNGCRLGAGVIVWDGALIGHHSVVEDGCWLTGSAAVGGGAHLGAQCFLGLHATVGHGVTLGEACFLGARTLATRDLPARTALVEPDTPPHRLDSRQFFRLARQSLVE